MLIEINPHSGLPDSRRGLVPTRGGPELALRRQNTLSHLQSFFTDVRKASKSPRQRQWERRWIAASGAWCAVVLALLLGGIDWRAAVMVAATTFMLARGGDMLDGFDE